MGLERIKRLILGDPLTNEMVVHERLPKWQALPILSSDALSSVAYATEEMLIPLAAFALAAVTWSMPVAIAIAALLIIVTISYRQTIEAYPTGGGAYTVSKENLGTTAGLVAGASLLIDYTLTVAVSVAAGVASIASAMPWLQEHKVLAGAVIITLMTLMNLRGVKESATVFAFPTYFFVFTMLGLIATGTFRLTMGLDTPVHPIVHEVYPAIPLFLILRAFSSGCTAMAGIEAITNGVPLFREPRQKNAKLTMAMMACILGTLFLGITFLAHSYDIIPQAGSTAISLLGKAVFKDGVFYYCVVIATAMILFLAANTGFSAFPLLASMLAKDRFLPRQLASLGDRLVFSNAIFGLSFAAIFLLYVFKGDTHALIPLYAVGVFLSFTLSQTGMVMHHLRKRQKGWTRSLLISGTGALMTFGVLIVVAATKFTHGAWMVIVLIAFFVFLFKQIQRHYLGVARQLSHAALTEHKRIAPLRHTAVVPISGIHPGVMEALRYAVSISKDVRACYVELDPEATERLKEQWKKWAPEIPLVVLKSPFRSVIGPVIQYIDDVENICHDDTVTVIIPEFITSRWYHQFLHNQTALMLRAALRLKRGKVVTSVRYHLS